MNQSYLYYLYFSLESCTKNTNETIVIGKIKTSKHS